MRRPIIMGRARTHPDLASSKCISGYDAACTHTPILGQQQARFGNMIRPALRFKSECRRKSAQCQGKEKHVIARIRAEELIYCICTEGLDSIRVTVGVLKLRYLILT